MKNRITIGILGFGVVGTGAAQVLIERSKEVFDRTGLEIEIKKICDLKIPRKIDFDLDKSVFTDSANDLLNDSDIQILIELIGGISFAKDFIKKALKAGKHIVTANKHLLALHGAELFALAKKQDKMLLCEAAVCGAIPCLRVLRKSMPASKIKKVSGIFNGTANYILTKLQLKGGKFQDVLKEAQELGYAEADPTFDIEGIDAAHKVAILANFAFGVPIDFDRVKIQGISNLIPEDFRIAKELGYKIKLIGSIKKIDNEIFMSMRPRLVKKYSKLGQVDGVMNAVMIDDEFTGPILLEGPGAGGLATGSAVVSDIIEIAKHEAKNHIVDSLSFRNIQDLKYGDSSDIKTKSMFRIIVSDQLGILAKMGQAFAEAGVSIDGVFQKPVDDKIIPVVFILESSKLTNVEKAVAEIAKMNFAQGEPVIIPIEENE